MAKIRSTCFVALGRVPADLPIGGDIRSAPWVNRWSPREGVRVAVRLPDGAYLDVRTWAETAHEVPHGDVVIVYDVEAK